MAKVPCFLVYRQASMIRCDETRFLKYFRVAQIVTGPQFPSSCNKAVGASEYFGNSVSIINQDVLITTNSSHLNSSIADAVAKKAPNGFVHRAAVQPRISRKHRIGGSGATFVRPGLHDQCVRSSLSASDLLLPFAPADNISQTPPALMTIGSMFFCEPGSVLFTRARAWFLIILFDKRDARLLIHSLQTC
jgi:hypothetical protein